jgi:hypothetical protein
MEEKDGWDVVDVAIIARGALDFGVIRVAKTCVRLLATFSQGFI